MTMDLLEGGTSVKASWLCGLQSRKASWVVAKWWRSAGIKGRGLLNWYRHAQFLSSQYQA